MDKKININFGLKGFDCNCQGKGFCAQVGTEETSEPEFFCICNDNTYGSRCDEGKFKTNKISFMLKTFLIHRL